MHERGDQKIILTCRDSSVQSLDLACTEFVMSFDNEVHIPFSVEGGFRFLTTLDGMLCVGIEEKFELIVWNPATTQFINLNEHDLHGLFQFHTDSIGFFIDSSEDYYVMHIKRRRNKCSMVYVYSLLTREWELLPRVLNASFHDKSYVWSDGTLFGTGLYFLLSRFWDGGESLILRFDVNLKVFSEVPAPSPLGERVGGLLVNAREELCMIVFYGFYVRRVELWKLINESWRCVQVLDVLEESRPLFFYASVTFDKVHEAFILISRIGEFYKLDVMGGVCTSLCYDDGLRYEPIGGAIYVESVVSPMFRRNLV
jgi:F-box interacting protein